MHFLNLVLEFQHITHGTEVKVEHFPDGTQRIVLENLPKMEWRNTHEITWKFETEEELSTLIYVTRHLRNMPCIQEIYLNLLYLPNARMDRIHNQREVFTLRGFADVINWLRFDVVRVLDVHSNVGAALLNNVLVYTPERYIKEVLKQIGEDPIILYFPDEGAAKRYSGLLQGMPYCYGEKKRDWDTGKILGLNVRTNGMGLGGQTVLMIDDIIACGICIGLINEILSMDTPIWLQAIIGSCIVTTGEFISGCILNLWIGLGIWDYSNMPFNLLGQICLPFSLLWIILSACAIVIDDYERYWFFGEEKPYYRWKFKEKK